MLLSIGILAALAAPFLAQQTIPSVNLTTPYWRRTGCYLVGHTRNITIPGCLKFSLITNACRGYCMSYSIPVNHDLGPPPDAEEAELSAEANGSSKKVTSKAPSSARSTTDLDGFERTPELGNSLNETVRWTKSKTVEPGGPRAISSVPGGTKLDSSKREVLSVSRCCSMVETEDRVYNVRCGFNEIRRLVFKSAKSCECFFCKQV